MKNNKSLFSLVLALIFLSACKQNEADVQTGLANKEVAVRKKTKSYGLTFEEQDSLGVQLNLADYQSYKELLDRVKQIECSDRIVKLVFEDSTLTKAVYLKNHCDERPFKLRNIVQIHQDTLIPSFGYEVYPLDSLQSYSKKAITNNGKDKYLSESPEKLHFVISYFNDSDPKRIIKTLTKVTEAFDQVGGNNILKVLFAKHVPLPPPPTPPAPEVIEVIEDEMEIEETIISDTSTSYDEEVVEIVEVEEVETVDVSNSVPFSMVEEPPAFEGCEEISSRENMKNCTTESINRFFNSKLDFSFTSELDLTRVQKVLLSFYIDKKGNIIENVVRGSHPKIENEVKRVLRLMPKFDAPGKEKGNAVVVSYTSPIIFRID